MFTKSFLVIVALMATTELAVRVFYSRGLSGRFDYGYHPTAGFRENADGSLDLVRAGGRRFLPQHYLRQRPSGLFRVMVVGDSVPRGPSLAEAYAAKIGELFRQRGNAAEGWNLCLPGYGAHRCHLVLRKALDYQPSLVIRHLNNSNEYEDEREWRRSQDFKGWHPGNLLMKSALIRRLHEMKTEGVFWALLPEKIRAQRGVNDAAAELAASTDEVRIREWQKRVRDYLAEDIAACRKAGVPMLLVTQVRLRGSGSQGTLDDSGLDELARSFAAPDVAILSMKELLSGMDFAPLFMDNAHLKAEGHLVLARAILERVTQAGMAPSAPK
ncbi:MAG: hypothetical protein ABMA01_08330 [Chthoniobacteraceae bacterium]